MKNLYNIRLTIAIIVLIASILAIFGFYPINFLDLQFAPLLSKLISNFSVISLIFFVGIIVLTIIFGRIYCSIICPFGILQEIFSIIFKIKNSIKKNYPLKYFILAIAFGFLIIGSNLIIKYIDPYTIFGSFFSMSIFGIILAIIILAIVFFKNRFFCSNICPVGAILGLLSKFSLNKIYIDNDCINCKMCENACPTGSIDCKNSKIDNVTCVKCFKCIKNCPKGAIKFKIKSNDVKFNPKRRDFIYLTSVLVLFSGAIKVGYDLAKNVSSKLKNIILPPGSKNASYMKNKCLNCNLCINNCPNKILSKANDKADFIHIDYSKGKGFCEFNCNNCSKACPSGAINKISLEEKQNTQIAIAVLNEESCTKCSTCIEKCPKGAISKIENKIVIDSSKCIGCGKCAIYCPNKSIEIFAIKNQSKI